MAATKRQRNSVFPDEEKTEKLSVQTKTVLYQLYAQQHSTGKTLTSFLADLAAIGHPVPKRTFQQWGHNIERQGSAGSLAKASGRPNALDDEQLLILSGFIFLSNDEGREVHLLDYVNTAKEVFDVDISTATASRYLRAWGFCSKVTQRKQGALKQDRQVLAKMMWQWVQDHQIPSTFARKRSLLCSVDFTYTGHRTDRRTSFAYSGESQPATSQSISRYTNCLLTCLWADGKNRTPCVLFTYNQQFRLDRPPTPTRSTEKQYFLDKCKEHNVSSKRVIYVGKSKGETRTYVAETGDLVRKFFAKYGIKEDVVVLSDNGNAFFEGQQSIIESLGFKQHICYPAAVHQWLSPNDNRLHGSAKARWRSPAAGIDFSDDINACLKLMRFLDLETASHSRSWFDTNMMKSTRSSTESLITGATSTSSKFRKLAIRAWQRSQKIDPRNDLSDKPKELQDELDGDYYLGTEEE